MKKLLLCSLIGFSAFTATAHAEFKKGDQVQTLVNLHPDPSRHLLYTMNYQLPGLVIPPCTTVTITKIKDKVMKFKWNDLEYSMVWDKYTKAAGKTVPAIAEDFFGPACDKVKLDKLSAADKAGVKSGMPAVGMSKDGVLFAMGRPPYHVNPDLSMSTWTYWKNKFARTIIEFDDKGIVSKVK